MYADSAAALNRNLDLVRWRVNRCLVFLCAPNSDGSQCCARACAAVGLWIPAPPTKRLEAPLRKAPVRARLRAWKGAIHAAMDLRWRATGSFDAPVGRSAGVGPLGPVRGLGRRWSCLRRGGRHPHPWMGFL